MKKALIVGNWKSYVASPEDGLELLKGIDKKLPRGMTSTVVVCPPSLLVAHLRASYKGTRVQFGVQDISLAPQGAHTGEVTATLARTSGAIYVILGHAERRAAGETSDEVSLEVRAALDAKLIPIVCVGEPVRDGSAAYLSYIETMLIASLRTLEPADLKKIVIAYEPVWAIGAPTAPGPRVVSEAVLYIRKILMNRFGRESALKVPILYGGAVDDTNAYALGTDGNAQGFLVGRASVDPLSFTGIIRACESKVSKPSSTT